MSRSMAQRMQDDEDHRLALCGLSDDPRLDWELEDREYQYHDFRFHPARPPVRWVNGGEPGQGQPLGLVLAVTNFAPGSHVSGSRPPQVRAKGDDRTASLRSSSSTFFASGRRDPAPTVRSGGQGVGGGSRTGVTRALAPPSSPNLARSGLAGHDMAGRLMTKLTHVYVGVPRGSKDIGDEFVPSLMPMAGRSYPPEQRVKVIGIQRPGLGNFEVAVCRVLDPPSLSKT